MVSFASKHNDPKANLSWSERIGYGMGNYGLAWVNGIMSAFFMLYLTNVAVLDAGVVGTIIAVSKVFDGVSDLVMGGIVDRTKSKHGKARIWLLRMCIHGNRQSAFVLHSGINDNSSKICICIYYVQPCKLCILHIHVCTIYIHELSDDRERL